MADEWHLAEGHPLGLHTCAIFGLPINSYTHNSPQCPVSCLSIKAVALLIVVSTSSVTYILVRNTPV